MPGIHTLLYSELLFAVLVDQIIASANAAIPAQPSKLHCEKLLPAAPPVEADGDGVGVVVVEPDGDGVGVVVVVVLEGAVEFPVASINTPPATAAGETDLVPLVAAL